MPTHLAGILLTRNSDAVVRRKKGANPLKGYTEDLKQAGAAKKSVQRREET